VIGVDRPAVLRRARRAGAIAATASSPAAAASRCEIVILAAPPVANLRVLRALARSRPAAVITDVGSVKGPICAEATRLGMDSFVGGHPMAGSAESGFAASDPTLFEGRPWILTPPAGRRPSPRIRTLIRDLGARAAITTPAEHDRVVAFLSHVPQVVAWALADAAAGDAVASRYLRLAGPVFRDLTRIARSSPRLWGQILAANRPEVLRALTALRRALARRAP
jgi:prephenate dehydrogenase